MNDTSWYQKQAAASLRRLLPRLETKFASHVDHDEWQGLVQRMHDHFPKLFECLYELYGGQYDFFFHLESILASATEMWIARPAELKALDALRETDPYWYQSHRMLGAMCYVDLFASDLSGVRERLGYLLELGVNYLHLMPLFQNSVTMACHCASTSCSTTLPTSTNGPGGHWPAITSIRTITGCFPIARCPTPTSRP